MHKIHKLPSYNTSQTVTELCTYPPCCYVALLLQLRKLDYQEVALLRDVPLLLQKVLPVLHYCKVKRNCTYNSSILDTFDNLYSNLQVDVLRDYVLSAEVHWHHLPLKGYITTMQLPGHMCHILGEGWGDLLLHTEQLGGRLAKPTGRAALSNTGDGIYWVPLTSVASWQRREHHMIITRQTNISFVASR